MFHIYCFKNKCLFFSEQEEPSPPKPLSNGVTPKSPKLSKSPKSSSKSEPELKMKGFKDFKQLQKEMKDKERELKRRMKEKKKSNASSTTGEKSSKSNSKIESEAKSKKSSNPDDSDDTADDDDLPDTYIEEVTTERQFVDVDGSIKTEITTFEVNKNNIQGVGA